MRAIPEIKISDVLNVGDGYSCFDIGAEKPLAEDDANLATAVILTAANDLAEYDNADEWALFTTNGSAGPWQPGIRIHVASKHYRAAHDAAGDALRSTGIAFMTRPAMTAAATLPHSVTGLWDARATAEARKAAN